MVFKRASNIRLQLSMQIHMDNNFEVIEKQKGSCQLPETLTTH